MLLVVTLSNAPMRLQRPHCRVCPICSSSGNKLHSRIKTSFKISAALAWMIVLTAWTRQETFKKQLVASPPLRGRFPDESHRFQSILD